MTDIPITMCRSMSEVNESLNLGITKEEFEQTGTSNAVFQGKSLGIYYINGLFLSVTFATTDGKITGIETYDSNPFGSSPFHAFLDGTVLYRNRRMKVSYNDADLELNDGDNIHISQLIKELILHREIAE